MVEPRRVPTPYFMDLIETEETLKLPGPDQTGDPRRLNSWLYGLEEVAAAVELPQNQVRTAILEIARTSRGVFRLPDANLWITRQFLGIRPATEIRKALLKE